VGLEASARADAHELADAELHELLDHDRGRRAAHAARLDGDGRALERPRVAQHPSFAVSLHDVGEERLRDVLRPQGVAGEQAGLCVVAWIGTNVDWHARSLREVRTCDRTYSFTMLRSRLVEPSTEQILAFCAADPVERVYLEDVARRSQGRFAAV